MKINEFGFWFLNFQIFIRLHRIHFEFQVIILIHFQIINLLTIFILRSPWSLKSHLTFVLLFFVKINYFWINEFLVSINFFLFDIFRINFWFKRVDLVPIAIFFILINFRRLILKRIFHFQIWFLFIDVAWLRSLLLLDFWHLIFLLLFCTFLNLLEFGFRSFICFIF